MRYLETRFAESVEVPERLWVQLWEARKSREDMRQVLLKTSKQNYGRTMMRSLHDMIESNMEEIRFRASYWVQRGQ